VDVDLIKKIERVIASVQPEFIFCHFPDDTHQDHRHLAQAIMSATRYIRNVLFFEGPTTQNFNPQVYVDIADTLEAKLDALRAHRSQVMKTNIEDLSIIEVARSCANFGHPGRVKYAEAFHSAGSSSTYETMKARIRRCAASPLRRTGSTLNGLRALTPGFERSRPVAAESLDSALRCATSSLRRTGSTPHSARLARLGSGL
jgi:hypothetical protein